MACAKKSEKNLEPLRSLPAEEVFDSLDRNNCDLFVLSQPLGAGRKGAGGYGAVDGQYAVEVVNLMLQQLRKVAFGFKRLLDAMLIRVFDSNLQRALDSHHQIGKAEAIVPQLELLAALPRNFRIDERACKSHGLHSNEDYPVERANLRRSDSAPEARITAKGRKRVAEVAYHIACRA